VRLHTRRNQLRGLDDRAVLERGRVRLGLDGGLEQERAVVPPMTSSSLSADRILSNIASCTSVAVMNTTYSAADQISACGEGPQDETDS
jgi:hypothetical protein